MMKQFGDWGGVLMYCNIHFFTRQAARETKAARQALTDAARQRHLELATHYSKQAEQLQQRAQAG
jgi:alpha-D-ribose 1-methylphosphonate 5-triphosphate diphosphatase PhnM